MSSVAAIIILKEKELVTHFRQAGALSPDTARTTADLRIDENVAFRALKRRAIFREVAAGRYYLDEPSWTAFQAARRRMVTVLLTVVLALFVVTWLTLRGR